MPIYDGTALRVFERAAIAACDGDDALLMQRAGQAGWRALLRHWPQAQTVTVVCGPGNNGGDGYVLAMHALAAGRRVRVVRLPGHAPRTALARRFAGQFAAAGGVVESFAGHLEPADVVVDALFGIGLRRAPEPAAAALIAAVGGAAAAVLALDVPSGVDADTGAVHGAVVTADHTLQFIAEHAGLRTGAALDHVGVLALDRLEVAPALLAQAAPRARLLQVAALANWLRPRPRDSHKGSNGHVLCIGGDHGMGGAVALCAQAALRAGAGLVSVASRAEHVPALLAAQPACMSHALAEQPVLAPALQSASVLALGPGLGVGAWGQALFEQAIACDLPKVIDADALNVLAATPRPLSDVVLTPHPGEAARLLGCSVADVQHDRFAAAQALATRHRATVVLKGAGSIVADGVQTACVIGAGNPGMAVGGMGDVLTGVVAALLGQGLSPFAAACCGALLHAHAGDLAARSGERGMLPLDVVACLRAAANPASSA